MNKRILILGVFLLTVSHTYGTRIPFGASSISMSASFERLSVPDYLNITMNNLIEKKNHVWLVKYIVCCKEIVLEGLKYHRNYILQEETLVRAMNTLSEEIQRLALICRTLNKEEGTRDLLLNFEKQRDAIINPFPEEDEHRYILQQVWDEVYNRPHTPQPAPDIPAANRAAAQQNLAHLLFQQ